MSVKAKFYVAKVEDVDGYYGKGKTVTLNVVHGSSEPHDENTSFFNSTPGGTIGLYCVNPAANDQFVEGKQVYVTFEAAE